MMENNQIVSRMNTYLHTSAKLLEEWLGNLLPKTADDWWEECVIEKLSYIQRETAKVEVLPSWKILIWLLFCALPTSPGMQ